VRAWAAVVGAFTRASRRRLKTTPAGRWVLFLALAVGFAALNTGNNLLFFGWGLVLSAIVISGILSESTLQAATPSLLPAEELRARQPHHVTLGVKNHRRVPAFGVELSVALRRRWSPAGQQKVASVATAGSPRGTTTGTTTGTCQTGAAFELRLSPGASRLVSVPWQPPDRGVFEVESLRVATAAPFGFFSKERIFEAASVSLAVPTLTVLPARVDTRALGQALWARLGERPAGRAGVGDELFSLRPYREGDDPRRIAWRRVAKTGRVVVRESEATQSRDIFVELRIGDDVDDEEIEDAIATAGSLIEDLLQDGHAVGLRTVGLLLPPSRSPRQRDACLRALATLDAVAGPPPSLPRGAAAAIVAVVAGKTTTDDVDVVVNPLPRPRAGA
jgi:uncharacterized protein (DUF58 family)